MIQENELIWNENSKLSDYKNNDYKLNNLVQKDGVVYSVGLIILDMLSQGRTDYQPIKLTEDILLKCGFEKNIDDYILQINGSEKFFFYKYEDSEIIYLSYCEDDLLKINYLHELQNLYFALTKQELPINLP